MTSRRSFLFAHRKMPEEKERGRWREEKTSGRVTAGVSEQTHACDMREREREGGRVGGVDDGNDKKMNVTKSERS